MTTTTPTPDLENVRHQDLLDHIADHPGQTARRIHEQTDAYETISGTSSALTLLADDGLVSREGSPYQYALPTDDEPAPDPEPAPVRLAYEYRPRSRPDPERRPPLASLPRVAAHEVLYCRWCSHRDPDARRLRACPRCGDEATVRYPRLGPVVPDRLLDRGAGEHLGLTITHGDGTEETWNLDIYERARPEDAPEGVVEYQCWLFDEYGAHLSKEVRLRVCDEAGRLAALPWYDGECAPVFAEVGPDGDRRPAGVESLEVRAFD